MRAATRRRAFDQHVSDAQEQGGGQPHHRRPGRTGALATVDRRPTRLQGQRRIPEVYLDAGRIDPAFATKRATAACASSRSEAKKDLEDAVPIPDLAYARARKQFLASACLASRLLAHDSKHPLDSVRGHGGNTVGIRDHVVASTHSDATTLDVIADRDDPGAAESVKRTNTPERKPGSQPARSSAHRG